ncbi:hypothetical protein T440DRAFT_539235 [Plenodomus tracheiphilus IPT5]|uniref:Ribonucleases P/MRP subunit Pop8-like domain-containing protein n=1 Tax=Plenodomus tracheiphilus IPT5 TaxID=1408161 RepID=A0A6A7BI52_9PLEO|nr:hypothetical protein T440DRAFT_539235 [Plenodomus tracheiphilus IPT5]
MATAIPHISTNHTNSRTTTKITTTVPNHSNNDKDTSIPDAPPSPPNDTPTQQQQPPPSKKRKKQKETHILFQTTFRKPKWSYMHLILVTPGTASLPPSTSTCTSSAEINPPKHTDDISPLLASPLLLQPLTSYLGTTGSAIPIDILKTQGRQVWLRVPRQDVRAVRASLSSWVGNVEADDVPGLRGQGGGKVRVAWRILGEAGVLGGLGGMGDGGDLFG